jgi:L-lactate dehydrogenase complex protein LldF
MNTCPVYRRSGGHSYGVTVPGPIGSILSPARDPKAHGSLPFACSQCGSCTDVCPVGIDLHQQLLVMRRVVAVPRRKRMVAKVGTFVFRRPRLYGTIGRVLRWLLPKLPRFLVYRGWNPWGAEREMPELPRRSFRQEFRSDDE